MSDLTSDQQRAVEHIQGPLLVLAGPGSGKTRVITRRIRHLLDSGISAANVLAITFTNKAAREMGQRVLKLAPDSNVEVSTFHSFCARLLRRYGNAVGLEPNFTILDQTDQRQLIRQILLESDFDPTTYKPSAVLSKISRLKNDMLTPEQFSMHLDERVGQPLDMIVSQVFPKYVKRLLDTNCADFDDLLTHVVHMLQDNPELSQTLDRRYKYILVDEYQDTNAAQYRIVAMMSQEHPNLCVTGDPDQSIYGWRGARIDNILRFEAEFSGTSVVRLNQNFRSTPQILSAADSLIGHNRRRKPRTLTTDNSTGPEVELLRLTDQDAEADFIAGDIAAKVQNEGRSYDDFAIFYRVNALSRQFELAFGRHHVPFQLSSGYAFYQRAEIKDLVAYLRLIENPSDETAFLRVINTPPRGIGEKTQQKLLRTSQEFGCSPIEAARNVDRLSIKGAALKSVRRFVKMIDDLAESDTSEVTELLQRIIEVTGYVSDWLSPENEVDQQRISNVQELVNAARQYELHTDDESDVSLAGFLESCALVNDGDNLEQQSGNVTLMTLHAAKGLEFPVAYIVGIETGLLPHERSLSEGDSFRSIEEERRLLFVGMTRAKEELYLTETQTRMHRGNTRSTIRSPFLDEIEPQVRDLTGGQTVSDPVRSAKEKLREQLRNRSPDAPLITTAADLLNGTMKPAEIPSAEIPGGFEVGMLVRHPRYGRGTVTAIAGMSRRRTVTVKFNNDRIETFVANKSPLQPLK